MTETVDIDLRFSRFVMKEIETTTLPAGMLLAQIAGRLDWLIEQLTEETKMHHFVILYRALVCHSLAGRTANAELLKAEIMKFVAEGG